MRGHSVVKAVGYPDQMQAREAMILEFHRLGSKARFCETVGLSQRYVNLIMEWKRAPTHWKLLQYFGWDAVYAVPEDLMKDDPLLPPKRGRPPLSFEEKLKRLENQSDEQRRAYWRQKQKESRERRRNAEVMRMVQATA